MSPTPGAEPSPTPGADPGFDRDDFIAAQRRHRWSARLRSIPAVLAAAALGIPLGVYLSPVLLGVAILLTDLVNLLTPAPDLGGRVWDLIDQLIDGDPGMLQAIGWILGIWLVPGVVGLILAYLVVRARLARVGGEAVAAAIGARPPRPADPEERQLVDVVGEFALAAGIEPPRVLLYDDGPPNALAFGRDHDHATILVGRSLLTALDREATQGVIARATASVVDGDLGLATDVGAVYITYGLLTTVLSAAVSPSARHRLRSGVAGLAGRPAAPGSPGIGALIGLPSDDDVPDGTRSGCLTLITMGGLIEVGTSLVNLFLSGPLVVLAWRSRGFLADAVAVDLTRNPTALARALRSLGDGRSLPGSAWLELLLVVGGRSGGSDDAGTARATLSDSGFVASVSPSVASRIAHLVRMGAEDPTGSAVWAHAGAGDAAGEATLSSGLAFARARPRRSRRATILGILILAPLIAVVAVLVAIATALIVFLVALAAYVILLVVAGPLHEWLRSVAGR